MRVVLDTNVWVSAFLTPGGICDKLVRAHHPVHLQFLVCRSILGELEEVLGGKIGMPAALVDERMKYVIRHSLLVEPSRPVKIITDCDADNRVLECADSGRASFLVTGDKGHLQSLGRFEGVEVVNPRRMVDILKL